VCASHCAQLLHTILHRTDLIVFSLPSRQSPLLGWCLFEGRGDKIIIQLEMWTNAQRDGRPAEHRWRPLFNAAKFGWCPLVECRAVTLPRLEIHWNLQGCLKLANRSQPVVGRNSPYYEDIWRRYCCLTIFFRLWTSALVAKIWVNNVARWCRDGDFLRPVFTYSESRAARFRPAF